MREARCGAHERLQTVEQRALFFHGARGESGQIQEQDVGDLQALGGLVGRSHGFGGRQVGIAGCRVLESGGQQVAHFARAGEAIRGFEGQRLEDGILRGQRNFRAQIARLHFEAVHLHRDQLQRRLDRRMSGEQFEGDGAERVDVAFLADPALHLFRRHVAVGAGDARGLIGLRVDGILDAGDSEVDQLHVRLGFGRLDHDVFGLEVAVVDALIVGRSQRAAHLMEDRGGASEVHSGGRDQFAQRDAVDELHHQERRAFLGLAFVEYGDHARVVDAGEGFHLLPEFADGPGIGLQVVEHLDHDGFGDELLVLGEEHRAEAAAADLAGDAVAIAEKMAREIGKPRGDGGGLVRGLGLRRGADVASWEFLLYPWRRGYFGSTAITQRSVLPRLWPMWVPPRRQAISPVASVEGSMRPSGMRCSSCAPERQTTTRS